MPTLFSLDYLKDNGVLEIDEEVSDADDTVFTINESYVVFLDERNTRDIISTITQFKNGTYSVVVEGVPNNSIDTGIDGDCALVFIQSDLASYGLDKF